MEELKEKLTETESEEVVYIEDRDAGLVEKDVEDVKKLNEKKVTEQHVLNKEQQEIFSRMLDEAKMPVKMTDGKFALGENELDIRYLSKSNKEQMFFRQLTLLNVDNRQMMTTLIDITRLLMIVCDKLGVEDIVAATDEVLERVGRIEDVRKQLKEVKEEPKAKA